MDGAPCCCSFLPIPCSLLPTPFHCALFTDHCSLHLQHYAESGFAGHHSGVGFFGFFQRIDLVHGFDAGEGAEFERVFGVHAGAGGPAGYGAAAEEERERTDDDGAVGCADDDEFAGGGEAVDDPFERFGAGDGGEDDVGAADFLEFLGGVLRGGVDVEVRAELFGEGSLVLAAGDGDGAVSGLGGVLDGEVAEAADAEDERRCRRCGHRSCAER